MSGRTEVRPLDLASLASVRAFAAGWAGDLDVLINNAGIMQVPHGVTQDGLGPRRSVARWLGGTGLSGPRGLGLSAQRP